MIRLRLILGVIFPMVLVAFYPVVVDAVASTNDNFNTVCFERRSTEASSPDDTTGFSEEQMARVEAIKDANRFRNLPREDIIALGTQSNEAVTPIREEEPKHYEAPKSSDETFHLKGEHILLGVLVLVALGVVLFGGKKRQ